MMIVNFAQIARANRAIFGAQTNCPVKGPCLSDLGELRGQNGPCKRRRVVLGPISIAHHLRVPGHGEHSSVVFGLKRSQNEAFG